MNGLAGSFFIVIINDSMQTDFIAAVKQIAAERGIDNAEIMEALKQAIRGGFKRDYPEEEGATLEVEIDEDSGDYHVYADKKVVNEVTNEPTQISLEDAQKLQPNLKVGDHVLVEITHTGDFGRVAAQAARQVVMQKIKEAEKDAIFDQFIDKIGTVESGIVQRMDRDNNVIVEIYRASALMPTAEQIPSEFYQSGARIKVLLKEIKDDIKGKNLIVSRSDVDFLRALFAMEVPEIASETVEIMGVAREPGSRSKVAVKSNADGVDPIGSCVGQRGSRINAITNELKLGKTEEKIDIIPWEEDPATYIGMAIRPAEAIEVKIINASERQALILVDDEYLSLAIGRDGQNVRLAAKLTGWRLDIQGEKMYKDNKNLSKFEMDARARGEGPKEVILEEDGDVVETSSESGDLDTLGLSTRVLKSLNKAGISSIEKLKEVIESGEKISGVGDKSIEEIKKAL